MQIASTTLRDGRKFHRYPCRYQVKYFFYNQHASTEEFSQTENLSVGGVSFSTEAIPRIGQRIVFSIWSETDENWSDGIEGIVVWREAELSESASSQKMGIQFSPDHNSVNHLVNRLTSERDASSLPRRMDEQIESAYDGSKVTFKLLRYFGWGPLNNLGYFKFSHPFELLNIIFAFITGSLLHILPDAQKRLVCKSIRELDVQAGEKVLDVACGKGASSFILAGLHPEATVFGVDLLPRNIQAANALFSGTHNLRFDVGDAMDLNFNSSSFDRMTCIEAAFHFPNKRTFLQEANRALRPGGRLVLVDFMWADNAQRACIGDKIANEVKREWEWNDFFTIDEYAIAAKDAGFSIKSQKDWSAAVACPLAFTFMFIGIIGSYAWGRVILRWINPLLKGLTPANWRSILSSAKGHDYLRKKIRYMCFVLDKSL